jgi:ribonuclease P protein component
MGRPSPEGPLFLRRHTDIERVKRTGRRFETPLFNLVSYKLPSSQTQIGIVVGRRLGSAVLRNRAKRIFRELARQLRSRFLEGWHILVFPRRKALTVTHLYLRAAWVSALEHEGLLASGEI